MNGLPQSAPKNADTNKNELTEKVKENIMVIHTLNAIGLRCPKPILQIAAKSPEMAVGDILEVTADYPTFEKDIRAWCERLKKVLLFVKDEGGGKKKIQILF